MKETKEEADYHETDDNTVNCHNCTYMHDDGTCEKVMGIVKPNFVCMHWIGE